MRLTIVISSLKGGGAERVAVNLANAWAGQRHAVTMLTTSQRDAPPSCAVDGRVVRRDLGWPSAFAEQDVATQSVAAVLRGMQRTLSTDLLSQTLLLASLREAILLTEPDVVVAHIDVTNIRVLAALHETNVPVIACEHTDAQRVHLGAWQSARNALYPHAHAVVAPHASIARWFVDRGMPAVAIANPLVAPVPVARSLSARRRLVTLTRLSREKRVDLLLHAFARVTGEVRLASSAPDYAERLDCGVATAFVPEWDLEIYGDGPLRASLESLAPSPRVRFRGFTSDPYGALRDADLFVSSSGVEGFGNAIWEALACGLPVVAVDCGAPVRSLVRHGIDGLLVPDSTVASLASALRTLMADDELRQRYASRAAEVVTRWPMAAALEAWDVLLANALQRQEVAHAR
jgi:GalNAc-alpha-(1->4)-GalNAc-alpha-(1->3)-diNAcBac-PP-undecaprenol alpha-1,4-N-acetyl-D-galactosaminyltransferase